MSKRENTMTYNAALDVSLHSVSLASLTIKARSRQRPNSSRKSTTLQVICKISISSVELDAGTVAQYLTYGLQSAGFEVNCMEARQVKAALSAMRNKTDKHDARGIALILRSSRYCYSEVVY